MSAALDMAEALTGTEATRFDDLEQVIERGLGTFVEVGNALVKIRDGRLYRERFASFESYCKDRWGLSRSYAYQVIDGAKIAGTLSAIADTPAPASEAVARQLAPLKDQPEEVRATWKEATEQHGPKPTAAQVAAVVARKAEPKPTAKQAGEDQAPPTHVQLHAEAPEPEEEDLAAFLTGEIPGAVSSLVAGLDRWAAPAEDPSCLRELLDEASKLDLDLSFVDLSGLVQVRQQITDLIGEIEAQQSLDPGDEAADDDDTADEPPPEGELPGGWTLDEIEALAAEHRERGE